ncbi:MAG: proline dehydrogenase [Bacteroidetes bacterium]|nr:proline dehydrogenase [Bacteroidota bacterium]
MISFENTEIAFKSKSEFQLKKAYWLFKIISSPTLVKLGKIITPIALNLRLPIKKIIKSTIFSQFCGGESIKECSTTIDTLARYRIGTILDYSVEGQESLEGVENTVREIIGTIERGSNDTNIPFAVFKVSGIATFSLLEKVSSNIILSEDEQKEFLQIEARVNRICQSAFDCNLPIFIDAEESWIQKAIDDIALKMMLVFNKKRAIVYNTLQMYRWDRMTYLKFCSDEAKKYGIIYGVKLVRGAYMEKERLRAEKLGYKSPIHASKEDCDKDFDTALEFICENHESFALCAGTHNEISSLFLTQLMKSKGISCSDERFYFAQLLGMSDHISFNLSNSSFNVAKYVPYGPVKEVLPYLLRRADENTSVAGQTGRELSLIQKEKMRRKLFK